MSDGLDPAIQLREEKIALAGEELVQLLKKWEETTQSSGVVDRGV